MLKHSKNELKERNQEILKLYREGLNGAELSKIYGISRQRISAIILNEESCERNNDRRKLTEFQIKQIEKIKYPEIRKFMMKEQLNPSDFCRLVFGYDTTEDIRRILRFFYIGTLGLKKYADIQEKIADYIDIDIKKLLKKG